MPINGERIGYTYKVLINGEWQDVTIAESPLELVERFEQDEEWTRVRHGHWKRSQHYPHIIFCDECGEPFELSNSINHWNYCPNCGAKMDEVEE